MMKKKKLLFRKIFKETLSDLKCNFGILIQFELVYRVIMYVFMLPFAGLAFNYFMQRKGYESISNKELIGFASSKEGLFVGVIYFIILSLGIILELIGLITISNKSHKHERINVETALITALKNFKKMFSIGGLQVFLYVLFIVPLSGFGVNSSIFKNLTIPTFIEKGIFEHPTYTAVFFLLIVVIYVFSIRWMFFLHISILEDAGFANSLKRSRDMCKKRSVNITITLVMFQGILALLAGAFYYAVYYGVIWIVESLGTSLLAISVTAFILILRTIISEIARVLAVPLNVLFVSNLYYEVYEVSDQLYVPRKAPKIYKGRISVSNFVTKYKGWLATLSVVAIVLMTLFNILIMLMPMPSGDLGITAHRGSSLKAMENSTAAIEYAITDGADYVEIDVQETEDGVIILTHDTNLNRLLGVDEEVWAMTAYEIQEYDIISTIEGDESPGPMPTLKEVIDLTKGKIKLNIEIKPHGYEQNMIENLVKMIEEEGILEQCVVTSLDYGVLEDVEALNNQIKTGYIMFLVLGNPMEYDVDFFSVESSQVTEKLVEIAHDNGREVHVWTVNDVDEMLVLSSIEVDNIITDIPEELKAGLDRFKNLTPYEELVETIEYLLMD